MDLRGKVIIITGASSGIGKALAMESAKYDPRLVLAARSADKLKEIESQLTAKNIEVISIPTDVTRQEDCKKLISQTLEKFDRIDILINNAGISMRAKFEEVDLEVLKKVMDVNFWGAVYCTRFALPHIIKSGGSVTGVSSIAGYRGLPGRTGYSSSKFALQGFLESLRTEMLDKGVHVLTACPGFTASGIREKALTESGAKQGESPRKESKMMSAEEVARRILEGIRKEKRTLVMTTQGKLTVFLNKWLPGLMDRLVYNHFKKEEGEIQNN